MSRTKVIERIMELYLNSYPIAQKVLFTEAIKHISDTSLVALALELGIDTDRLFAGTV